MSGIDESQPDVGNVEDSGKFLTSIYDGNVAFGAPVSSQRPSEKWQQDLSIDLGDGSWALMFKLQSYSVEQLMFSKDAILSMNDIGRDKRDEVEAILIKLFCEGSGHVGNGIRNLRKYRTSEGQTVIVLSSSHLHSHTKHPIVLIVEEPDMPPRLMSRTMLIEDGGKGDKLTKEEEKQLVKEVFKKLLQGISIPNTEVKPSHSWIVEQTQGEVQNCYEPSKAYFSPVMCETMLTIYYRHNTRGGISGECLACDTVEAMVKHVCEDCDDPKCPQRQFLAKAYAQHIRGAKCGSDPTKCSIPFCGHINYLVRQQDVENPSPWLASVVVNMIKLKRGA